MIWYFMLLWTSLAYGNSIRNASYFSEDHGVVPGRHIAIPARDYITGFKVPALQLGDCALQMQGQHIKTCSEKFGGTEIWIPSASAGVDVSRVRTAEDVITYGMGGMGANIGVLGLVGVGVKVNVAVQIQTSSRHLSLMTSHELKRGVKTLHNPQPLSPVSAEGAIFLSEIELGGSEMLLVTMEFNSFRIKVEVEAQLQIKILFIAISAKMRYVHESMKASFKTRIQFKSSWRPQENLDKTFSSMSDAIEEVERIEAMYVAGPNELAKLDVLDERLHNMYYFSFWKKSPYGKDTNFASMNYGLSILNEHYVEIQSVIQNIEDQLVNNWMEFLEPEKKESAERLKEELISLRKRIVAGMNDFSSLDDVKRKELYNIYGIDRAPGFYERKFKSMLGY